MAKATKEAKVHTSWTDPAPDYDRAVEHFTRGLLADDGFVDDLDAFLAQHDVVARGRRWSLAQTALLLTCPGVPDLYQGSELWDTSLVDPDNRRPVDYATRRRLLRESRSLTADAVTARMDEGAPKQWLIQSLLAHRHAEPASYRSPVYEPLAVTGAGPEHLLAFTRGDLVVVVPRAGQAWDDTEVELPAGRWSDVLTGVSHDGGRRTGTALLRAFPVAVLGRRP
jgi:(1->4)-alpha-D-glucan 1-alpha-D-glucosylmutase